MSREKQIKLLAHVTKVDCVVGATGGRPPVAVGFETRPYEVIVELRSIDCIR